MKPLCSKPSQKSYHTCEDYRNFLGLKLPHATLEISRNEKPIQVFKREACKGYWDLFTPVNYQPKPDKPTSKAALEQTLAALKEMGCLSIFLQTREDLSGITSSRFLDATMKKNNFYLDLKETEKDFIQRQKRDARLRLKKGLETDYHLIVDSEKLEPFSVEYCRLSRRNLFEKHHHYKLSDFYKLLKSPYMDYLEIQDNKKRYLAGGFFGHIYQDVDYLYGSCSSLNPNATRMLIYEACLLYQRRGYSKLYLGGGMTPSDSLSTFKRRLGSIEVVCSALRAVVNVEKAEDLYRKPFSQDWFHGFFPPYREPKHV